MVAKRHLDTAAFVRLAGRHLLLGRNNPARLEAVDLKDFYTGGYAEAKHEAYCLFSLPLASVGVPVFSFEERLLFVPPHVYVLADGYLGRVLLLQNASSRDAVAEPAWQIETVATNPNIQPRADIVARIHGHGTDLVFSFGERVALLKFNRFHQPQFGDLDDPFIWAGDHTATIWHPPVISENTSFFVSQTGNVLGMEIGEETWKPRKDVPSTLGLPDEIRGTSPPCLAGNTLYVAYASRRSYGIAWLNTRTGEVGTVSERALDVNLTMAPLPFGKGVLWPMRQGEAVFYVTAKEEKGVALQVESGLPELRFSMQHSIMLQGGGLAVVPGVQGNESQLVSFTPRLRRQVLRVLPQGRPFNLEWWRIQSLLYVRSTILGHRCLIVQADDELIFIYL